jgi:hypothetical protein
VDRAPDRRAAEDPPVGDRASDAGESDHDATVMLSTGDGDERSETAEAADLLRAELADRPPVAKEMHQIATQQGIGKKALRKAVASGSVLRSAGRAESARRDHGSGRYESRPDAVRGRPRIGIQMAAYSPICPPSEEE